MKPINNVDSLLPAVADRYRLLARLAFLASSSLDLDEVLLRMAEELHPLLGCDQFRLVSRDGEGRFLQRTVDFHPEATLSVMSLAALMDASAQWVWQQRRIHLSHSVEPLQHSQSGLTASVHVPLICRNECRGVLGLFCRAEDKIEAFDLGFVRDVSNLLATAVDNTSTHALIARLKARLEEENTRLREEIGNQEEKVELIGHSRAMRDLRQAIQRVAATDSTVLILGESGTGKELVARAIHEQSPRRERLLVKVNCAALSPALLVSELFGHEAGAFTGAARRRLGRFELAQGGSIFLDEIGEVSPETQVLLLRVLQERVLERVGGNEAIAIDVRVLAATNRDLQAAVKDGRFRLDLFYRLNVFPLQVPPLRERPEDIPLLMEHILQRLQRRMGRSITSVSQETVALLQAYRWPGNVRELENVLERALVLANGDILEIDPNWLTSPASIPVGVTSTNPPSLANQERHLILTALESTKGKIYGPGGAAELLGLRPTTLYGKMRKHGIRKQGHWTT